MFDEVDDDDFDGELGEDDEELPMIQCTFRVDRKPKPKKETVPSPQKMPASQ